MMRLHKACLWRQTISSIDLDQGPFGLRRLHYYRACSYYAGAEMKHLCEFMSEGWAAAAAVLWFVSASIRLKKPSRIRRGLESGFDEPKAVLLLVLQAKPVECLGGYRGWIGSRFRHR
jgi:hypothetical protein